MPPEIQFDDATLIELGKLAAQVGNNPKTRRQFFKAVREIDPERYARYADQRVEDKLEELEEKRQTEAIEREGERHRIRQQAQRESLASRYDEETIKKIETEVMVKNGIGDYELAAKLYAADLKPTHPRNDPPKRDAVWKLPDFEGLQKDPTNAARNMAFQVIDELNAARR